MATQALALTQRLAEARVDFVIVGGIAATFHGTTLVTDDLDICVRFDLDTCERLLEAVHGLEPRERMRPDRPPLANDPSAFVGNRNLYLWTTLGVLDVLGEITGVGGLDVIRRDAVEGQLGGFTARFMSLDHLLASKRAVGRPKDLRVAIELEELRGRSR